MDFRERLRAIADRKEHDKYKELLKDMVCVNPRVVNGVVVGCGKCINCRVQRGNEWKIRVEHEALYYNWDEKLFVTLTYDDEHIPVCEADDGTEYGILVKKDYQLFLKRLRKQYKDYKIRYFMSGEYGSEGNRPHFHFIIFGLPVTLLHTKRVITYNQDYLECEEFKDLWHYGGNSIGTVTSDSIGYVCKYLTKEDARENAPGQIRTFCESSQGIGLRYCMDNATIIQKYLSVSKNNHPLAEKIGLPRYYQKKLGINSMLLAKIPEEKFEEIKRKEKFLYSYEEYEAIKNQKKAADRRAMETLKRGLK